MRTILIPLTFAAALVGGPAPTAEAAAQPDACASAYCVALPGLSERIALLTYLVDRKSMSGAPLADCRHLSGSDRTGCAVLEGLIADARRNAVYASLSKGWKPDSRAAFARLLAAEERFAIAVGENETDHVSAESAADAITAQQAEKDSFLILLKAVVGGTTKLSFVDFAETDSALDATYAQVMAVQDTSNVAWGSVEKAGIARTQQAWLAYREAFVAFAATRGPGSAEAVKAELTTRRTVSLESFLED